MSEPHKPSAARGVFYWGVFVVFGFAVYSAATREPAPAQPAPVSAPEIPRQVVAQAAATPMVSANVTPPPVSAWEHRSYTDQMTGKPAKTASLESSNELSLDYPYQGSNGGRLTVRQSPQFGLDAFIEIERGQMLCGVDGCTMPVRFDDGKPQNFSMVSAADHSSTILFFSNTKRFIEQARKAQTIRAGVNLYQGGQPGLVFETPVPLEWPKK